MTIRFVLFVAFFLGLFTDAAMAVGETGFKAIAGGGLQDAQSPGYRQVEKAWSHFKSGDPEAAKRELDAAVKQNAELSPPGVMLARMYFATNRGAVGRRELERAVVDRPKDPEAHLLLADVCFGQSMIAAAELLYQRASDHCERCPRKSRRDIQRRCYAGLASVAEARRQWKLAEDYLRLWIQMDADSAVAQTHLAQALFMQGKYQEAWKAFEKLHRDNKSRLRPEINMGLLYERLVQQGDARMRRYAEESMKRAWTRDPKNLPTRLAVAKWALETGRLEIAKKNAVAATTLDAKSLQAQMLVGHVARCMKDYQKAEAAFRLAHLQSPTNFSATNQLALVLIEQAEKKKRQLALQYAQLNARTHSNLSTAVGREAAATLGWVLFRHGQPLQGRRNLRIAVNAGSLSADAQFFAAHVFHQTNATDAARLILEALLKRQAYFATRPDAEVLWATLKKAETKTLEKPRAKSTGQTD